MNILEKFFGDANDKYLKSLDPLVSEINGLEKDIKPLSQAELKIKTIELKKELKAGKSLEDILPVAFAMVREAAWRTLEQRHYDVQLIGGIVLHKGQIAEMRTGEGKTLTATLAVYLNALEEKGVHVITVNDYLSRRDAVWMGQIYNYLGLSVSCLQHDSAFLYDETLDATDSLDTERDLGIKVSDKFLKPVSRNEAYAADITYGTNNEFGFDYLRDNMVPELGKKVQRPLNFTIIDEVDSVLIDEARTPLIISAPAEESNDKYYQFAKLVRILSENEDYNIDEKMRSCTLTEDGVSKIEKALNVDNIYETHGINTLHHLEEALKAEYIFKKDKDYVVKQGEVIIVDEFTGRLMQGRRYSGGLHQAIEAKEAVTIQRESVTMATVTFQNYFRMYNKIAGMTGTAATEGEEFSKIYSLDVTIIPTNKPTVRKDNNDKIYVNELAKYHAVVKEIKERNKNGQPVLIGTISIEKNEVLSQLLTHAGVEHEVLNAKNHAREAEILAQAGRFGAVTVATNMAGRGVDIILGGNPKVETDYDKVIDLGGLHVIGTERHESRRIDNQLRGRGGRQGDPGSSQFFVSMEDDLMRIFGSDRMKNIMTTLKVPEDMPIENKLLSRSIESAQRKVEGNNFDIRKHLVEYDDVLSKQRNLIYDKRDEILELHEKKEEASTKDLVINMVSQEFTQIISFHLPEDNKKEIIENVSTIFPLSNDEKKEIENNLVDELKANEYLNNLALDKYSKMEEQLKGMPQFKETQEPLREIEKFVMIRTIDNLWVEHLEAIEHLRTGIGLRGYGQRDPLIEYKKESFNLFEQLLSEIQNQVVHAIFKYGGVSALPQGQNKQATTEVKSSVNAFQATQNKKSQVKQEVASKIKDDSGKKVGRNDPCPCGSGKKYKKCCGK
mgnify:CR=1 FL=1|jgi:preprotein translocase subunit SecA